MGMAIHPCMPITLQIAKRSAMHKTQRRIRSGRTVCVSWNLLADLTCPWHEGVALKVFLPLNEVFRFWTVVQESAFRPERGLLRCFRSRISAEKRCRGREPDIRALINETPKSVK